MEQDKYMKLLLRQVKDIQVQADKIVGGDNSAQSIENFARYSNELKAFILSKINNEGLRNCTKDLAEIKYSKIQFRLWQILVLPLWFVYLYKDYIKKGEIIRKINMSKSKYATIEMIIKQYMNSN